MWRETIELEKLEDEEVLLQSRTSIDKSAEPKNCGYLHLTNKRIVWTQAAQPKPMINIPFSEITSNSFIHIHKYIGKKLTQGNK